MRRFLTIVLMFSLLPGLSVLASAEIEPALADEVQAAYLDPATDDMFDPEPLSEAVFAPADVPAKAAILMEKETGTVIYALAEHERLAPASVTKIMTMLLVAEAIDSGSLKLDDIVTVSARASAMGGSQVFLSENERMSVQDLLKSVAVGSANDASVALAEHLTGSEDAFVGKMNSRAKALGMNDTIFANCTGLPAKTEHLTSAYDIAVMSRELLKHPFIRDYTTIWMDTIRNGEFGLSNTNKLVRFYPGTTGLKTGFTDEAKFCVSATAERDGIEFIAVILGSPSSNQRFDSAKALLSHAFALYTLADICPEEPLAPIPVTLGEVEYVQLVVKGASKLLIEKESLNGLQRAVEIPEFVAAPVTDGQEIGRLIISNATGAILADVPLCADRAIEKLTWGQILLRFLRLLFVGA
ncbi:MAG: D-alanyl-D-alanine carboxypeptidase [Oscillospiraceae bacterium]|nr:D-alanyl-D-alanine carboxypeptidase [Oscillospiraceae bacterium]